MQWTTPLWAETAGTSHSEDEEVSTSSAPLTKTNGGYEMRIYDQVTCCGQRKRCANPDGVA